MRRKSDPSRVAERDRRAAGHGDRVAPRDCADAGLGLPARTGGGQAFGTAGCSRCGHGRRPRRWRRAGRTGDRFAWRSGSSTSSERAGQAPTGQRAESVAQQPGLARSVGARDGHEGPGWHSGPSPPRLSPSRTLPERAVPRQTPGLWTLTLLWTRQSAPTRSLRNRADAVSHSPHSHRRHPHHQEPEECAHRARHTDNCREFVRSQ